MNASKLTVASLVPGVETFRFEPGITPLTHPLFVTSMVVAYVVSVHAAQRFMRDREPIPCTRAMRTHNMFLVWLSALLGTALFMEALRQGTKHGLHYTLCSLDMHRNGPLQFLYFINYLTKIYEFVDTFLMIARKRPVPFLHWYHHAATLLLTYTQMMFESTMQWAPILLNLWVHVIMYYYYYLQASGVRKIWWKQWVTVIQIAQFVVDLMVCAYAFYYFFTRGCNGTWAAAVSGIGILVSYLVLFLSFYINTYRQAGKRDGKAVQADLAAAGPAGTTSAGTSAACGTTSAAGLRRRNA